MNRETIFVFKPLSQGLGLEHGHQLRNGPGRWSLASRRGASTAAAVAPSVRRFKATPETQTSPVTNSAIRSPLLFWQRCLALWCDGMVSLLLAFFVVMVAGLFAALIETGSFDPAAWLNILGSFEWVRQSAQMIMSLVNLATIMPWLPFCALFALFGIYRISVGYLTGISVGQWFVRWLVL